MWPFTRKIKLDNYIMFSYHFVKHTYDGMFDGWEIVVTLANENKIKVLRARGNTTSKDSAILKLGQKYGTEIFLAIKKQEEKNNKGE